MEKLDTHDIQLVDHMKGDIVITIIYQYSSSICLQYTEKSSEYIFTRVNQKC